MEEQEEFERIVQKVAQWFREVHEKFLTIQSAMEVVDHQGQTLLAKVKDLISQRNDLSRSIEELKKSKTELLAQNQELEQKLTDTQTQLNTVMTELTSSKRVVEQINPSA